MTNEHLPTYTWNGRNTIALNNLVNVLNEWKVRNFTLVDIGPGGLAKKYAYHFPEGDQTALSLYERAQRKLMNIIESRTRDLDNQGLVCFEVPQIISQFEHLGLEKMFVVDKFKKVLDATDYIKNPKISRIQCNLEKEEILYVNKLVKGKVVIALHVLERCYQDKEYAERVIINSVEDGGYLLLTLPKNETKSLPGFIQLKKDESVKDTYFGIFYKGERKDKMKTFWTGKVNPLNEREIVAKRDSVEKQAIKLK